MADIELDDEEQPVIIDIGDDEEALAAAQEKEKDVKPAKEEIVEDNPLATQLEAAKAAQAIAEQNAAAEAERAAQALQYAQRAEYEAWQAKQRETSTHADMAQTGLHGAQQALEAAKADYSKAFDLGDANAMAEANARIARSASDIREWERSAAAVAEQAEYARQPPQRQAPVQQQRQLTLQEMQYQIDSDTKLMPGEKAWLKQHPEARFNPAINTELGVAFKHAVERERLQRDTPEYFAYLNKFMGYEMDEQRQSASGSRVSAPVSRGSGGPTARPDKIKLTERDIEIANSLGLKTNEQLKIYARNKANVPERMKELNGGMK